jgi:hypothetical protein
MCHVLSAKRRFVLALLLVAAQMGGVFLKGGCCELCGGQVSRLVWHPMSLLSPLLTLLDAGHRIMGPNHDSNEVVYHSL